MTQTIFKSLLAFSLTFTSNALAQDTSFDLELAQAEAEEPTQQFFFKGRRGKKACKKLNMTMNQKEDLRAAMIEFKKSQITLKAEMKKARIDFRQTVRNTNSSTEEIQAAIDLIDDLAGQIQSARPMVISHVLVNVLNPDQRKKGLRCLNQKFKRMKKRAQRRNGMGRRHRGHLNN